MAAAVQGSAAVPVAPDAVTYAALVMRGEKASECACRKPRSAAG